MLQPFFWIREPAFHLFALKKTLHDLRNVQPGFHIQVNERLLGIVKASGVLLLHQVRHHLHRFLRGEYLVCFLRRDIVEDIFCLFLIEVIGQRNLQTYEFFYGIIKDNRVKDISGEIFHFSGFFIQNTAAVSEKSEFIQRNTRYFNEHLVGNDRIKGCKRNPAVPIGHQERRNRTGEAAQMVFHRIFNASLLTLFDLCIRAFHNFFCRRVDEIIHHIVERFFQSGF